MAWTDDMIAELKKLWSKGMSTGEIGKKLGVTKNSVVGKVHRLGLDGRPSPIKRKDEDKTLKSPTSKPEAPKAMQKKEAKPAKPEPLKVQTPRLEPARTKKIEHIVEDVKITPIKIEKKDIVIKKEGDFSLIDLDGHSCRWPIGDPKDENFHFCGKKIRTGQTYCDEHSAIAYVKILKK